MINRILKMSFLTLERSAVPFPKMDGQKVLQKTLKQDLRKPSRFTQKNGRNMRTLMERPSIPKMSIADFSVVLVQRGKHGEAVLLIMV